MASAWRTVDFSSSTPPLLIKTRFDRNGYDIQLTDLSRIWRETLSKKEIVQQAVSSGCSFDPGDGDNYDTFLQYVESALNGEAKTTSNLRAGESGKLFLDLSIPLPAGLSALGWTVELVQLPDSAVATELVGPLLFQASSLKNQIQQLVDEISSKDHVIQKISDKLEANGGGDLTAVFPGVSNVRTSKGRGQSQRAQLAKHVRGLAEFDESAWRASHEKLSEVQELTPDVMNIVLQDLPPPDRNESIVDGWVQKLASSRKGPQSHSQLQSRSKRESRDAEPPQTDTQDDVFQRQETPPHLSKHSTVEKRARTPQPATHTAQPAQNGEDSETEDEDDDCLDIPPTASQQDAVDTIEQSDGADGGHYSEAPNSKEPALEATRPNDFIAKQQRTAQLDSDEETEGIASSPPITKSKVKPKAHDTDSEREQEPEQEPEPEKTPRKGGLGKFGGSKLKSELQTSEHEEGPVPSPAKSKSSLGKFGGKKAPAEPIAEPESSKAPTSKPKSTLGKFGGTAKQVATEHSSEQEKQNVETDSSARASAKTSATPSRRAAEVERSPERELTEEEKQQRADEKREKLKRELAEKAKGPAKKKRKF